MKLVRKNGEKLIFHLGKKEKSTLFKLLKSYPQVTSAPSAISKSIPANEVKEHQEIFEESLREHREENRRQLQEMLNTPGRFVENEAGFELAFKPEDVEWLLQVLNDVRIGNWLKLGSPDLQVPTGVKLTEENIRRLWEMDIAAHFEMALLSGSDT